MMNAGNTDVDSTAQLVKNFLDAFNRHDVEAILGTLHPDCVFESAHPAPNGTTIVGHTKLREAWVSLFKTRLECVFEDEETFNVDNRSVTRWNFCWTENGERKNIRGLDILHIEGGKIVKKLTYCKN